jgi:hypothetical protein
MANPEDIKFKLTTEGDASGAEEVAKSIFKAEDAAKQASRQADVDLVKQRQAAAAQKEQAETLREIADASQRVVAANLAGALGKIAGEFQGISAEADLALTGTQNFLSVFASTGNPIAASLALIGTAVNGVMDAYREAEKVVKASDEETAKRLQKISELRANYAREVREANLQAFFARELDELEATELALGRIAKIRQSERDLEAARTANAGAAAVAAGTTTEQGAAAGNVQAAADAAVAKIRADLALAAASQQKVADEALKLTQEAQLLEANTDAQVKALEAAGAKQAEAERLALDLDAQREISTNRIAQVVEEAKASIAELGRSQLDDLTKAVQTERDALRAEVDRLGTNASSGARAALAILDQMLRDGMVSADELGRYSEAQGRLNGMQEKNNAAVLAAFQKAEAQSAAFLQSLVPIAARLEAQDREIAAMKERLKGAPQGF